jgi:hypothetical protein
MTKRILHVSLHPEAKRPNDDALRRVVERASDWVLYAPYRWLIWTSSSPAVWYDRFREIVGLEDNLLIVPVELNEYAGYMPKIVSDWLRKHMQHTEKAEPAET